MKRDNMNRKAFSNEEHELNEQILDTIMMIREDYPELTKYLSEMPLTIPNEKEPEVRKKQLQDYLESLNDMVEKYHMENGGHSKSDEV